MLWWKLNEAHDQGVLGFGLARRLKLRFRIETCRDGLSASFWPLAWTSGSAGSADSVVWQPLLSNKQLMTKVRVVKNRNVTARAEEGMRLFTGRLVGFGFLSSPNKRQGAPDQDSQSQGQREQSGSWHGNCGEQDSGLHSSGVLHDHDPGK